MLICRFKRIWRRTHKFLEELKMIRILVLRSFYYSGLSLWVSSFLLFLWFYSFASASEGQGTATMEAGCCCVFLASVRLFLCYRFSMLPSSPSCLPLFLFILPVLFFSLSISSFSLCFPPILLSSLPPLFFYVIKPPGKVAIGSLDFSIFSSLVLGFGLFQLSL